jgi:hypothetical protein
LQDRITCLERAKHLVYLFTSQILKAAEMLRAEQTAVEKLAGKGEGKKGNPIPVVSNWDFSFPTKWDNYIWPKPVKTILIQKKKENPELWLIFMESLLFFSNLSTVTNRVNDFLPFLYLAEIISETIFNEKEIFKLSILFHHIHVLKKANLPFESKAHQAFEELEDKLASVLVNNQDDFYKDAKYYILLVDSLLELRDYYRARLILSSLNNMENNNCNDHIKGQLLLRLAKINMSNDILDENFLESLNKSVKLLDKQTKDYLDAIKMLLHSDPSSASNILNGVEIGKFELQFEQQDYIETEWLCILIENSINGQPKLNYLQSLLQRLYAICLKKGELSKWHSYTLNILQHIVNHIEQFDVQDLNRLFETIEVEMLEKKLEVEITHLIILINSMLLLAKSVSYELDENSAQKMSPLEAYLEDTDPFKHEKMLKEPNLLDSVNSALKKLEGEKDSSWIIFFSLGMLNYLKWKLNSG